MQLALERMSVFSRVRVLGLIVALGLGAAACVPPPPTSGTGSDKSSVTPQPKYLFDDEFNGQALDTGKWQPNWLGGSNTAITKPINGAEKSCYDPRQVSVPGDGYLHLTSTQRSCRANNGTTYAYASGLVNTNGHFTFTQGHLEARVWLSGNSSIDNWPAVWTDGTGSWPSTGESDIMEGLSGKACYHYHSPSGGPGGCASGTFTGWHTFGEDVHGGTTTYLYDGVAVGSETNVRAPHYIILNLGVGGYGANARPGEMIVDYVRVTQ
jgi:beta-glucanase (GH16 family)